MDDDEKSETTGEIDVKGLSDAMLRKLVDSVIEEAKARNLQPEEKASKDSDDSDDSEKKTSGLGKTGGSVAGSALGKMAGGALGDMLVPGVGGAVGEMAGGALGGKLGGMAGDKSEEELSDENCKDKKEDLSEHGEGEHSDEHEEKPKMKLSRKMIEALSDGKGEAEFGEGGPMDRIWRVRDGKGTRWLLSMESDEPYIEHYNGENDEEPVEAEESENDDDIEELKRLLRRTRDIRERKNLMSGIQHDKFGI